MYETDLRFVFLPYKLSNQSLLQLLVDEFYNLMDLDGNELIYGYDFYIKEGVPQILKKLEETGYWSYPKKYVKSWIDFIENNVDNLIEE